MSLRFGILTVSDRSAHGERPDLSGPALVELVTAQGWKIERTAIIADDLAALHATLSDWADGGGLDVILTTGGTGFAPRDVTPEATRLVIDREAPGLAEAMRCESLKVTPHAMLSSADSDVPSPHSDGMTVTSAARYQPTISALGRGPANTTRSSRR